MTPLPKPQARSGSNRGVSEGIRTPDRLDHNQELYQLSYAHRVFEDPTGILTGI